MSNKKKKQNKPKPEIIKDKKQTQVSKDSFIKKLSNTEYLIPYIILPLILLSGLILRLVGIDFGYPNLRSRPDEDFIMKLIAGILERGDLKPLMGSGYFFSYPHFYVYFMSGVYKLIYLFGSLFGAFSSSQEFITYVKKDGLLFFQLLRISSAIFGTLTILLVYKIGKRLFNQYVGIASAIILSFMFLHIRDSHFGVTDIPCTFLCMLSFYYAIKIYSTGKLKYYIIAAIFAGLATSTKYNAVLTCLPIFIAHLSYNMTNHGNKDGFIKSFISPGIYLSAVVMIFTFFITSPYIIIEWEQFQTAFQNIMKFSGGTDPSSNKDIAMVFHLKFSFWYGLGFALTLTMILGMIFSFVPLRKSNLLLLSFPIIYFIIIGRGNQALHARYAVPMLPFLAVISAFAIYKIIDWTKTKLSDKHRMFLYIGISLFIMLPSLYHALNWVSITTKADTRNEAVEWIKTNISKDEGLLLIQNGVNPAFDYGNPNPKNYFDQYFDSTKFNIFKYSIYWSRNPAGGISKITSSIYNDVMDDYRPQYPIKKGVSPEQYLNGMINQLGIKYIIINEHYISSYTSTLSPEVLNIIHNRCGNKSVAVFDPTNKKAKSINRIMFNPQKSRMEYVKQKQRSGNTPLWEHRDALFVPFANNTGIEKMGTLITVYKILK